MSQPSAVLQATDPIVTAMRDVQARLETEYSQIFTDPARARRRARIAALDTMIERELKRVEEQAGRWLADSLPPIYQLGAEQIGLGFRFDQFHRQAVELIQTDTYDEVLAATTHMRDDTKRWIRETTKRLQLEGEVEGLTQRQLARRLANLSPKAVTATGLPLPITAVTYSDGSLRTLDDYGDMLFRTKSAVAYNDGTINRAAQLGFDTFRIRDGAGCGLTGHDDGSDANGMIVDAATARAFPISHPRCRRSFSPVDDGSVPIERPPGVTDGTAGPEPVPTAPPPPTTPAMAVPVRTPRTVKARTPRIPNPPAPTAVEPRPLAEAILDGAEPLGSRQRKGRAIATTKPPSTKAQGSAQRAMERADELIADSPDARRVFARAAEGVEQFQISANKLTRPSPPKRPSCCSSSRPARPIPATPLRPRAGSRSSSWQATARWAAPRPVDSWRSRRPSRRLLPRQPTLGKPYPVRPCPVRRR